MKAENVCKELEFDGAESFPQIEELTGIVSEWLEQNAKDSL